MMRQYTRAKAAHPDAIVLFRMGDFYELFFDDAKDAARALDLTLTSRGDGIPMAGVPVRSVETYLRRLMEQGGGSRSASRWRTRSRRRDSWTVRSCGS